MRTLSPVDQAAALAVCGAFLVWVAWIWFGAYAVFLWRLRRTAKRLGMTVRVWTEEDEKGLRR